ncbi:hypothetical protein [Shewanella salipaludis]|uniref:Lipoprotein n=1 Tax=Shewanella salipaludis TaxID=2723052 RepID=A0A972FQL0_9GAMM|nr:hypothetical protein [Shewanella salipaludis]NMH64338.1 hypothetical protein [Shewanella salipaludis]
MKIIPTGIAALLLICTLTACNDKQAEETGVIKTSAEMQAMDKTMDDVATEADDKPNKTLELSDQALEEMGDKLDAAATELGNKVEDACKEVQAGLKTATPKC